VFAPSDDVFAALPSGTVEDLVKPENNNKLTAILLLLVLPGKVLTADIACTNGVIHVIDAVLLLKG
jgi:uncharacterized surface protein with fasciclin (FAS1) repeats